MRIARQKHCCRSRGGVLAFEGVDDLASREWVEQMPLIVLVSTGAGLLGSLFNLMHKWLFKVGKAGRGLLAVQLLLWRASLPSRNMQLALLCLVLALLTVPQAAPCSQCHLHQRSSTPWLHHAGAGPQPQQCAAAARGGCAGCLHHQPHVWPGPLAGTVRGGP